MKKLLWDVIASTLRLFPGALMISLPPIHLSSHCGELHRYKVGGTPNASSWPQSVSHVPLGTVATDASVLQGAEQ